MGEIHAERAARAENGMRGCAFTPQPVQLPHAGKVRVKPLVFKGQTNGVTTIN